MKRLERPQVISLIYNQITELNYGPWLTHGGERPGDSWNGAHGDGAEIQAINFVDFSRRLRELYMSISFMSKSKTFFQ